MMIKIFRMMAFSLAFACCAVVTHAADTITIDVSGDVQEALQEALILAEPGSTILIPEGTFHFTNALSLDVANITIKGAGMDKTILSFAGQTSGSEGLLITSDGAWLEGFAIEDTPGDGIKTKGVDVVSFVKIRVEWTGGPKSTNGAYGIYPVESQNVLVDGAVVIGASDAGIYVGQSRNIIVRNSRAEHNVAGIEIENCYFADVYNNIVTHNTGGILIFDMPNLPQKGGHSIRVFNNKSIDNDVANFAPVGNIVAGVPRGTGIMVMSNRDVEVFGNEVSGNASVNMLIVAYADAYDDPDFNPLPQNIYIHDNIYGRGGWDPDGLAKDLIAAKTGLPVPDIVWDGAVDGVWSAFFGPDSEDALHIKEAEGTTFASLEYVYDLIVPWDADINRDITDYPGSIAPRAPIILPQDKGSK
ncbi:MAG: right-handed parallel beta-helix repeat-containing protein [Kordiimonadaceae bacterium]|nr:right-handed parallel beta-helix repeat-containing protein [Kordiimonadaceae bacterium]